MKGQGGGGTAKGGGKNRSGGGSVKVESSKGRETKAIDKDILLLRAALREVDGKDKDVTKDIAKSFMKFDRNGLDLTIEFATILENSDFKWAFGLVKDNMEDAYEKSGYGWDDADKKSELSEKEARFLIVREWPSEKGKGKGEPVAFVHFRFTVQGEVLDKMEGEPSLYIYDIHVEDHSQKKGIGKHLLMLLELIARREKMRLLSLPVMLGDNDTKAWLKHINRGFSEDESYTQIGFDADMEGFEVMSKVLGELKRAPTTEATTTVFKTPAPATNEAVQETKTDSESSSPKECTSTDELREVEGGWLCVDK